MFKSLSVRLLIVFIIGFILLATVLLLGVRSSLKGNLEASQVTIALRMTRWIIDKPFFGRDVPPRVNIERAAKIVDRADERMRVQIISPETNWSSDGVQEDYSQLKFVPFPLRDRNKGIFKRGRAPKVSIARQDDDRIYKVQTSHAVIYYEMDFDHHWALN